MGCRVLPGSLLSELEWGVYYKSNRDGGIGPLSRLAFVVIDLQKFCQFV